jgi:hypothetical protein
MGGGGWSDDYYAEKAKERAISGASTFAYHEAVAAKPRQEQKVHARLDPKGVRVRESRDSLEHPESLAIGVMLDETGSMARVPEVVHARLPNMHAIATRLGINHPQFLFGAVGDEFSDKGSLQVGQYESDNRMAEDLEHFWLEGNGGGGLPRESYQNAIYFFARHTDIDCVVKRNKKGYLFILGDENPYESVRREWVESYLGYNLEGSDISTADIIKECQQKYHLFFIIPTETHHGRDPGILNGWRDRLGPENVLTLPSASDVCELIATTVGVCEGLVTLDQAQALLSGSGISSKTVSSVGDALYNLAKARGLPVENPKIRRL